MARVRKIVDLIGKRVGRLLVVSKAPDRIRQRSDGYTAVRPYWNCQCDCGNFVEVRQDAILAETSNSCGCLRDEAAKEQIKKAHAVGYKNTPENLIGKVFGRLTVISEAERSVTPKGRELPRWTCECKCGVIKDYDGQALRQGKAVTCGCVPSSFAESDFLTQTEVFVYKAMQVHGDKYIYDLVDYTDSRVDVTFICRIHGAFVQRPANHLVGSGCPMCSGVRGNPKPGEVVESKISCEKHSTKFKPSVGCKECIAEAKKSKLEEFILQSKSTHQNKYDYSLIDSLDNRKDYVNIICSIHGVFTQQAGLHANGQGCRACGYESMKVGLEGFIIRAHEVHNNRFNYSKVEYEHSNIPVLIICKDHGEFYQKPSSHLNGQKCPRCAGEERASKQHWNYLKRCELNPVLANSNGVVYLLKMNSGEEVFLKVGISSNYKKRLGRYLEEGLSYEILEIFETTAVNSALCEKTLLDFIKEKDMRYIPKIEFKGWTECADIRFEEELMGYFKEFYSSS